MKGALVQKSLNLDIVLVIPESPKVCILQQLATQHNLTVLRVHLPILARLWRFAISRSKVRWTSSWIIANLIRRIAFPDPFVGWRYKIISALRRADFAICKDDTVLSASGSVEVHFAASLIGRLYQSKVVMEYGDPWSMLVADQRPRMAQKAFALEAGFLRDAASAIFTTQATAQQYSDHFGAGLRTAVVPYGFDSDLITPLPDTLSSERRSAAQKNGVISVSHHGTAFEKDRSLLPLIEALSEINRHSSQQFRLTLAGIRSDKFDQVAAKELRDYHSLGSIEVQQSICLQLKDDVLVVIGNIDGRQLPGKIFMALALGKPILYVKQALEADEADRYLSDKAFVFSAPNNSSQLVLALSHMRDNLPELRNSAVSYARSEAFLRYSHSAIGKQLINALSANSEGMS